MKLNWKLVALLAMSPAWAFAQIDQDIDSEIDGIAQAAPGTLVPTQRSALAQVRATTPQYQKQPTTYVEASPLTESRADQIRRSRQDVEVQTEQRIVEKLEQSRIEDEKRRASVLFGDKFSQLENNGGYSPTTSPAAAQPVVVQAQPVQVMAEPRENTRDIIREELSAALKAEEAAAVQPIETKYVAGILGVGDYPDTRNVKGNYAVGVAFGNKVDGFIMEGAFTYSNYTVDTSALGAQAYGYNAYNAYQVNPYAFSAPASVETNQYAGSMAAKVQFFNGIVKPVLGGLVQYSYRTFNWSNGAYNNTVSGTQTANSHAIDFGAIIGMDLDVSQKYSLGLDYRYLWNLSSRVNNQQGTWMSSPSYGTPIEKLQYSIMSFVARVNF